MITLSEVSKVYRTKHMETIALNAVNVAISKGEFVAIMGPSGCGKSTLLNIIGLVDKPTSGIYTFGDEDVSAYRESKLVQLRRLNVGFVFQSFNLLDDLTVYENIELPLLYQNVSGSLRKSRVREVLELVGLEARAKHRPAQLSGGQQQRVAVARAVVGNPRLVLADEPTGNLDSQTGEEILGMLSTLNEQGTTVVMVTHSAEHAAHAHRVIEMRDGRIVNATQMAA